MTLLIQLQEGNYFRGNTVDRALINGEAANSFTFWNLTRGQLCVLPKKQLNKTQNLLKQSGFFLSFFFFFKASLKMCLQLLSEQQVLKTKPPEVQVYSQTAGS